MKEKKPVKRPTEYKIKQGSSRPKPLIDHPPSGDEVGRPHPWKTLQPWHEQSDTIKGLKLTQTQTGQTSGQAKTKEQAGLVK